MASNKHQNTSGGTSKPSSTSSGTQMASLEKKMAALAPGDAMDPSSTAISTDKQSSHGQSPEQTSNDEEIKVGPMKSMVQAVNEMAKETKLGEAKDAMSMAMMSINDTKDSDDPEWYSSHAMYWTAHPWRLARGEWAKELIHDHKDWVCDDWKDGEFKVLDYACGNGLASHALFPHVAKIVAIDNDPRMVKMYNEVIRRQQYSPDVKAPMQAYVGDLMPVFPARKAPAPTNKALIEALNHEGFDMVVVMLAMDCFENLSLSADDRIRQLMFNLDALISQLQIGGTLLILDFQKATTQKGTAPNGLKDGHKTTGYHSDIIVDCLKHWSMEVDVIDGLRFQWKATASEKRLWVPSETDESWFMIKATKKPKQSPLEAFQGAFPAAFFSGSTGQELDPEHMTPGMAEAMMMAMMSAGVCPHGCSHD